MPDPQHLILDNRNQDLGPHLRRLLEDASLFRLVTAYFSIKGFELLKYALQQDDLEARLLYGKPHGLGNEKERLTFLHTEEGLDISSNGTLALPQLAQECADWIKRDNVAVRTMAQRFMHGKMYLAEGRRGLEAVVGSSNFTRPGLGEPRKTNIELNVGIQDPDTRQELLAWFDSLWEDEDLTRDAKPELLEELERYYKEYAPAHIYYKTLYELFRDELDKRRELLDSYQVHRLEDTTIWHDLYDFQRDGVRSALAKIKAHNGCILADGVGLGKTYSALAVIKYFELNAKSVLVLCPKRLQPIWSSFLPQSLSNSRYKGDRFQFDLLAHTDLSRKRGNFHEVKVDDFDWGCYDLIVVDESHNFRNESKWVEENGEKVQRGRHEKLLQAIQSSRKTKVLLLSATPVNTSLKDLGNQISLITERRQDAFRESLGVAHVKRVIDEDQKKFEAWSLQEDRKKQDLLDVVLSSDFLKLLNGLTIARSRKQISDFYLKDMEAIQGFPKRSPPQNEVGEIDLQAAVSFEDIFTKMGKIEFHLYRPSKYLRRREGQDRRGRNEDALVALMRTNLLKRLESSVDSLRITLGKIAAKIEEQMEQIDEYKEFSIDKYIGGGKVIFDEDGGDNKDEVVARKTKNKILISELMYGEWRNDLEEDLVLIRRLEDMVRDVDERRDAKLAKLFDIIKRKTYGRNRKLLVFTVYVDTANYLYEALVRRQDKLGGIEMGKVTGVGTAFTKDGDEEFNNILDHFAPDARNCRARIDPDDEIDLLIATDCLAEGQNLHDCDMIVNFDIHWNPVRLIQRLGRIDRLGSKNNEIGMLSFWPLEDLNEYLQLERRVKTRMALASAVGSEEDLLTPMTEADQALTRKIREGGELADLEEGNEALSISDLTMDYFLVQLLRYIDKHKEELEATPLGAYAVTDGQGHEFTKDAKSASAIFLLRSLEEPEQQVKAGLYPFHLVLVDERGVRTTSARHILQIYEQLCSSKDKPLTALCDAFTKMVTDSSKPSPYHQLLEMAVGHVLREQRPAKGWGNAVEEIKLRVKDALELVTWLVIPKP